MSNEQTISGRILRRRDVGSIVFVDLLTAEAVEKLVARKDLVETAEFEKIKELKRDDFCEVETEAVGEDRVLKRVIRHIPKRNRYFWSEDQVEVVRAYASILKSLRDFLAENRYTEVQAPTIHPGNVKNEAFSFDFFGKPARLTSSNALFLDIYALQMQRVFCLQKCFRAEKSHTARHLAEFTMLEAAAMNRTLEDTVGLVERMVKFVLSRLQGSPGAHLCPLNIPSLMDGEFEVVEYKSLEERYDLRGKGLGKHEKDIASKKPLFVLHFPHRIASWSARPVDDRYSASFNLLLPEVGEVAEGAKRQTNMEWMIKKIKNSGMEAQLGWYPEMMPYTDFNLAGFGLGVERLAMWLLGRRNIRELLPIYRDTDFSEQKIGQGGLP